MSDKNRGLTQPDGGMGKIIDATARFAARKPPTDTDPNEAPKEGILIDAEDVFEQKRINDTEEYIADRLNAYLRSVARHDAAIFRRLLASPEHHLEIEFFSYLQDRVTQYLEEMTVPSAQLSATGADTDTRLVYEPLLNDVGFMNDWLAFVHDNPVAKEGGTIRNEFLQAVEQLYELVQADHIMLRDRAKDKLHADSEKPEIQTRDAISAFLSRYESNESKKNSEMREWLENFLEYMCNREEARRTDPPALAWYIRNLKGILESDRIFYFTKEYHDYVQGLYKKIEVDSISLGMNEALGWSEQEIEKIDIDQYLTLFQFSIQRYLLNVLMPDLQRSQKLASILGGEKTSVNLTEPQILERISDFGSWLAEELFDDCIVRMESVPEKTQYLRECLKEGPRKILSQCKALLHTLNSDVSSLEDEVIDKIIKKALTFVVQSGENYIRSLTS